MSEKKTSKEGCGQTFLFHNSLVLFATIHSAVTSQGKTDKGWSLKEWMGNQAVVLIFADVVEDRKG